jgi:excisionase family DNA binding protein
MDLLTVKETAQILRVSQITVRRYIASGDLPAQRVGRGIRVNRQDIEDFLEAVIPTDKPITMDDPLWDIVGIGQSDDATDIAEHLDEYIAEAILASNSDEDDAGYTLGGKPFTRDHPLWDIVGIDADPIDVAINEQEEELPTILEAMGVSVGIGRSGEPTNVAEHKDEYLADAFEAKG